MYKLQLPTVTLLCIDCIDPARAVKVLERCREKVDFGAVKLLTSLPTDYPHIKIMHLGSLITYSIFMLTRVHEFINTSHVLIVQRDGWILNPEAFNFEWLKLDYMGPLFVQYDKVGSGGFSLRSKKVMQEVSRIVPEWDGTEAHANIIQETLHYYEDGVISLGPFANQFKIASRQEAATFAQGGNRNELYFRERPFGFHRTWQEIDFLTGVVDSSDPTKDLHETYDHVIDTF